MKNTKEPRYLGSKSKIQNSPDNFILDTVKNPHPDEDYCVRFTAPEFTSICPITSQPDFGNFIVDYVPNKKIMESKSFKLFLFTFRNNGGFHEDCTIKVAKKIIRRIIKFESCVMKSRVESFSNKNVDFFTVRDMLTIIQPRKKEHLTNVSSPLKTFYDHLRGRKDNLNFFDF